LEFLHYIDYIFFQSISLHLKAILPKQMKAFPSKSFYQFADNESKFCPKKRLFFLPPFPVTASAKKPTRSRLFHNAATSKEE